MPYERIESTSRRKVCPTVAIKPDGKLRLNSEATMKFREHGALRVAIFWDKQRRKVALQIADANDQGSFKLSYSKAQNSTDIAARAFLQGIGWSSESGKVDVALEWNEAEKMFEGKLPK